MENLIFVGVFACLGIILFLRGYYVRKQQEWKLLRDLEEQYVVLPKKSDSVDRFLRIDRYYQKHMAPGQLDDITWNDLNMDEVFKSMNYTYSATGEEYLYYTLRNILPKEDLGNKLEKQVHFWMENAKDRAHVQMQMIKLGYTGKFSIYDYIDHLDYLGERDVKKDILLDALFLPFLILLFFQPMISALGIIGLLICNILMYLREKKEIEPYIISFIYVIRLIDAGKELMKMKLPDFEEELEALQDCIDSVQLLKKGAFWLGPTNTSAIGANPVEMVLDYLKMAFHVDLIVFHKMLSIVRNKTEEIDRIVTVLGSIETTIAISAYRNSLVNGYCIPQMEKNVDNAFLSMEDGYHPLITSPVKNTIYAKKGVLLTGSNASGKSTFLKMTAINAILAQTIHTCAAKSFAAPYFQIFSSMALRDDLVSGDSYYIVEIKSINRILTFAKENPEKPVLCFVDEVLRGTNTIERIAASTQILKNMKQFGILCFAATHDIELSGLLTAEYDNYHFEEVIENDDIYFPYQLMSGETKTRNAIKLLEIIGYDDGIVNAAHHMAMHFEQTGKWA